jgi:hypothetical protein
MGKTADLQNRSALHFPTVMATRSPDAFNRLNREDVMKAIVFVAALLLFCIGCTSQQSNELSQQQKDQIKNEVKAVGDTIIAKLERLDGEGALQFYADSPDWKMFNADGSEWDYQMTKKAMSDLANSATSYKWTTTRQDFIIVTKDIVICAWVGKDETLLKSLIRR